MEKWNSAPQKASQGRLGTLRGSTDYRLEQHVSTAMNVIILRNNKCQLLVQIMVAFIVNIAKYSSYSFKDGITP